MTDSSCSTGDAMWLLATSSKKANRSAIERYWRPKTIVQSGWN